MALESTLGGKAWQSVSRLVLVEATPSRRPRGSAASIVQFGCRNSPAPAAVGLRPRKLPRAHGRPALARRSQVLAATPTEGPCELPGP